MSYEEYSPLQNYEDTVIYVASLIADGLSKFQITRALREEYKVDLDFHVVMKLISKANEHLEKIAKKAGIDKGLEIGGMIFRLKQRMRKRYVEDRDFIKYNELLMRLENLADQSDSTSAEDIVKKLIEFKRQAEQTIPNKSEQTEQTEQQNDEQPEPRPLAKDIVEFEECVNDHKTYDSATQTEVKIDDSRYEYSEEDKRIDEQIRQARIKRDSEKLKNMRQKVDDLNQAEVDLDGIDIDI